MPKSNPTMGMNDNDNDRDKDYDFTNIRLLHVLLYLFDHDYKFIFCKNVIDKRHLMFFNINQKHGLLIYLTYAAVYIAYFVVGISYVLDFGLNVHRWRTQRASVRNLQYSFIRLINHLKPKAIDANRLQIVFLNKFPKC